MKKVISLFMALALCGCILSACGKKDVNTDETNATPTPSSSSEASEGADGYEAAMSEYIEAFEDTLEDELWPLMDEAENLSSEDEFVAWCEDFIALKETFSSAADDLADVAADVPEEYEESHALITVATAAIVDAMTGFEDAIDACINGDQSAFEDGIVEFLANIAAAGELWNEAIE